jgi:hypothetical protein
MNDADTVLTGDADAIAKVRSGLVPGSLKEREITPLWESVIIRIIAEGDKGARKELIDLGMELCDMAQSNEIYEDLFAIAAFPHSPKAYVYTIKTGANVVRANEGRFDKRVNGHNGIFLEMAKQCLKKVLEKGNAEAREYAADALRHFTNDDGVKRALLEVLGNGAPLNVKDAAGGSLGYIRLKRESEIANAEMLILRLKYHSDTPQANYIDYIHGAIDTVMKSVDDPEKAMEARIAVKQLSTFGMRPGPVGHLLDEHSLNIMRESVENALLHALAKGDGETREEAINGLEAIGSERVDRILTKIAERNMEGNGARNAALRVLKAIQKKKLGYELPPPLPLRSINKLKQKARVTARA